MHVGVQLVLAAAVWLVSSSAAVAASNCTFRSTARTWQLQQNCWTDATLAIPNGVTLDGRGRTITAIDPEGGHFLGAVVRNAGGTAHVRNLTIEARELTNVCDGEGPPDQRLRGILFEGASGTITGNRIRNLRQIGSGCQEGAAIEIRGPSQGAPLQVLVALNIVEGYQKTGVLANGSVEVNVTANRITGLGPVGVIAQNGIQLGFGATGSIERNRVEQNIYTGGDAASTGILLLEAGAPIEIARNRIDDNDIGIHLASTSDVVVRSNEISGSTYDGIAIDGRGAPALGNYVVSNRLVDNNIGVDIFGAGASSNEVVDNRITDSVLAGIQLAFGASTNVLEGNRLRRNAAGAFVIGDDNDILDNVIAGSDGVGLHVEGSGNDVQGNDVDGSGGLDIVNSGANAYDDNRCTSSSGSPVDCP